MSFVGHLAHRIYKGTIWAFTTMVIFGAISWSVPRDVIDVSIVVPEESYSAGDTIITSNHFESYTSAKSTYDNVIVCRNGIERRYNLVRIEATTEANVEANTKFEYTIPNTVEPEENCAIAIDSAHEVEIMPFLSRTYSNHFESNNFAITER